mgnify:FL=1
MARDKSTLDFWERQDYNLIDTDWTAPEVFPDLTNCKYMAIDLETYDPNLTTLGPGWTRDDGYIVGVAVAGGDFEGYYPIRHEQGGNLSKRRVLEWLKAQLATPDIPKVMHNATYDAGWLKAEGIKLEGRIIDTMIAAPLIDENRFSYSLNNLGRDYINMSKSEKALNAAAKSFGLDPKKDMWRLPSRFVGAYAEQDARITLRLWQTFEKELETQELMTIFDLETSLIPLMLEMRSRGVRVNIDGAEQAKTKLLGMKKDILADIKKDVGFDIEPWAAVSVAKAFEKLKIPFSMTNNEKNPMPSFTKSFLQACTHPIAAKVLRLRELDKAHNTFIDSILKHAHKGRIHCEFHQLRSDDGGTVTGRFSSSNPNLQQIPAREPEIKSLIRGLFLPEQGERWGSFDYSSQEPRLLVHYCASLGEQDRHAQIDGVVEEYHKGDADFHQMVADMAGINRKQAKTVNLGIMYGMGRAKLAATLDITVEEAKSLLERYHDKVPFVKGLADRVSVTAQKYGRIRTIMGRKCRFNMWEPRTFEYSKPITEKEMKESAFPQKYRRAFTYKALNKLIQGSAADQTKKAMADCFAEGLVPLMTVHDELCFSIESDAKAARIKEIMETGLELKVPSKVDQELGNNWGEVG